MPRWPAFGRAEVHCGVGKGWLVVAGRSEQRSRDEELSGEFYRLSQPVPPYCYFLFVSSASRIALRSASDQVRGVEGRGRAQHAFLHKYRSSYRRT